jgi:hypothetical protein
LLAIMAAACSDGDDTVVSARPDATVPADSSNAGEPLTSTVPVAPPAAVPSCDTVVPNEAPAEWYGDTPIYVANEQPVEELRRWAETLPGFQELWIDREHNGWVALAFSEDAEARQRELRQLFPDAGAVVVPVSWTSAALNQLQAEVTEHLRAEGIESFATFWSPVDGVVKVEVGFMFPEVVAALAPFGDRRVCVAGADPAGAVAPGPQPAAGDGWRLLADQEGRHTYRTGIATDARQYGELWTEAGLTGDPPAVDFQTEVVVWFAHAKSGSCAMRMDDVVVDQDRALVYSITVNPDNDLACTADANPKAYIVALQRDRLPAGPFGVQLGPQDPPGGAPEERTLVAVDLTAPGTVAAAGDIGPDPSLREPSPRAGAVASGSVIEPEVGGWRYVLLPTDGCGFDHLGVLNGVHWYADASAAASQWATAADPDGAVLVDVVLSVDPPSLVASAAGTSVTYLPVADAPTC